MSQATDFFVYLATNGEARQIFEGWPEGMAYAITVHPAEGISVHLHHESQVEHILEKIARSHEVEVPTLRVIPERPGHPTTKLSASQELAMLREVEGQPDLVESAEDYMINFEFAQHETPDEVYLAEDGEVTEPDTDETEDTLEEPQPAHAGVRNVAMGDYFVVDESTVSQPMRLFRDNEGRILLAAMAYRLQPEAELPVVPRIHMKDDRTGFFIALDDLPDEGDGCLVLPYSLSAAGVDLSGSEGRKATLLTTGQGWHVTILPKVEAPKEPQAPKPALSVLEPPKQETSKPKVFLNMLAGGLLAICLVGLGAVGTFFLMPAPTPVQAPVSPDLNAPDYLDELRARIYDQQGDGK